MTAPTRPAALRRFKAQRLEKILDTHAAWEKRTLADLRVAGFKFVTIEQAFRYRQAQRTLAAMSSDDLVEFVAAQMTKQRAS